MFENARQEAAFQAKEMSKKLRIQRVGSLVAHLLTGESDTPRPGLEAFQEAIRAEELSLFENDSNIINVSAIFDPDDKDLNSIIAGLTKGYPHQIRSLDVARALTRSPTLTAEIASFSVQPLMLRIFAKRAAEQNGLLVIHDTPSADDFSLVLQAPQPHSVFVISGLQQQNEQIDPVKLQYARFVPRSEIK